jgi:hypothetical protein
MLNATVAIDIHSVPHHLPLQSINGLFLQGRIAQCLPHHTQAILIPQLPAVLPRQQQTIQKSRSARDGCVQLGSTQQTELTESVQ